MQRRLRFLRANGFHTIYLDIGKYLDAADLPVEDPNRQTKMDTIRRQIKRFVATATGYGLSVQVLGGGPTWTGELHDYLGPKLVSLLGDYNTSVGHRERLKGVHLDLEPYTLPGWLDERNVERNLVEYLTTIEEIVDTPTGRSWTGRPTAASSWASPSRFGSTAAATPPARWSSAATPSRPPST